MKWAIFLLIMTSLPVGSAAHAEVTIECGGHIGALNDYTQWDLKISGNGGELGGRHYSVRETKRFYVLTRPGSEIQIDKLTKGYVEWGSKGRKAPPIEWSRNVLGEGCDIPKTEPK